MPDVRELLTGYIGDDTSDAAIALLEAFDDDVKARSAATDWERKYKDLDEDWRRRYIARFSGETESEHKEEPKPKSMDNGEKSPEEIDIADVIGVKE